MFKVEEGWERINLPMNKESSKEECVLNRNQMRGCL